MTKTVYQVRGEEYADEPAATAALAAILEEPVQHVDWLDVTSFRDESNGVRRLIVGMVNHRIEMDDDSDFEQFMERYRNPSAPPDEPDAPEPPGEGEGLGSGEPAAGEGG